MMGERMRWALAMSVAVVAMSAVAVAGGGEREAGFVPLFNGENLDGWIGATDGYKAEGGELICVEGHGGNLLTEKKYADFVLRFEFKLAEGSNNGLGIRVPDEGHPSYDGMELQILDNSAQRYADLEDYQYHGSLYGCAAAERGHLKGPGEWNEQEVIVDGRRVRVILNGQRILDADLDAIVEEGPVDGREHPGLERETGRIGFLGHGDFVALRKIRIKELD